MPVDDGLVVGVTRFVVAEEGMVHALVDGSRDRGGGRKAHVGDPQRDDVRGLPELFTKIEFYRAVPLTIEFFIKTGSHSKPPPFILPHLGGNKRGGLAAGEILFFRAGHGKFFISPPFKFL